MSEEQGNNQNNPANESPEQGTRRSRSSNEIPRRGYRDATGSLPASAPNRPPAKPPPPQYGPRPGTPPPPYRGRSRHRAPRDSGLYLPWWSLLILVIFVGGAAFGLLAFVLNLSGASLIDQTPQVIIVTGQLQPSPLGAISGPPTAISTFQPTSTANIPTAQASRTSLPGGCLLNDEVIVFGTGGVGLNLRDRPGGEVQFISPEGDKMLVIDGPQFFDDVEWCQVRSTRQGSSFGWAALEFLIAADAIQEDG